MFLLLILVNFLMYYLLAFILFVGTVYRLNLWGDIKVKNIILSLFMIKIKNVSNKYLLFIYKK